MKKSKNKHVVITGGNSGIGYALTKALLEQDHYVGVLDIQSDRLADLKESYPDELIIGICDMSEDAQVANSMKLFEKKFESIDVFINNACWIQPKRFFEKSMEEIQKEMQTNYFGYVRGIQAVLPYMKKQGWGVIHNMSSTVGMTGYPDLSGYTPAKSGVESLIKTLNMEMEKLPITINVMFPPLTLSESSEKMNIPEEAMKGAEWVGTRLAQKVGSTQRIITTDVLTRLMVGLSHHFPNLVGKLMNKMKKRNEDFM